MIMQIPYNNAKLSRLGIIFLLNLLLATVSTLPAQDIPLQVIYLFPETSALPEETVKELRRLTAVELDMQGNIFLTDSRKNRVIKLDSQYRIQKLTAGWGTENEFLDNPADLALDAGLNLLVADYYNGRIVRYDRNLNFLSDLQLKNLHPDFEYPLSLTLSGWGDIYVLEEKNGRVLQIQLAGNLASEFGGFSTGEYSLSGSSKIAAADNGNIYAALPLSNEIAVYDRYGNHLHRLQTAITPQTVECAEGITWYGGKEGIGALKGDQIVHLEFMNESTGAFAVKDIAAARGKILLLLDKDSELRTYRLSKSPAKIQW